MSTKEDLISGFGYDFWANSRWLDCLSAKSNAEQDLAILGHVLSAQTVWLKRCQGFSLDKLPEVVPTEEILHSLYQGWLEQIELLQGNPIIDYRNTKGEPHSSPAHDIMRHVINHGTYHRGELRGLCLARNDQDFPETDLILYTLTR